MEAVHILIVAYLSIVEGDSKCGNTIRMPNKCLILNSEVRSWNESNNFCVSQRANLVMPKQITDHKAIEQAFKGINVNACIWIGIKRNSSSFSKYSFTSTREPVLQTHWNLDEPNHPYTEQCVDYKLRYGRLGWNDEICEEQCYSICEKKECPQHCEKKETSNLRMCSNGAKKQGGTCFFHNRTLHKNWNDARTYCFTKGARLTKSRRQKRDDIAAYLSSQPYTYGTTFWTAGQRKEGNIFVYADWNESMPASRDWSQGEPNNVGGKEDCISGVFRESIKLNDDNCMRRFEVICIADECPEDCTNENRTNADSRATTCQSSLLLYITANLILVIM